MRLLAPALGLLLAAAPAPDPAAPPVVPAGFTYTREVDVPAPGWVRVPLDLAALQHLLPGGADLHVFDPEGRELPRQVGWTEAGDAPAGPAGPAGDIGPNGASIAVASSRAQCEPEHGGLLVCRLALPAAQQVLRQLTFDLEGDAADVAFRLYAPRSGRWQLLAEGIWQRTGERTLHVLPIDSKRVTGADLRLELSAVDGSVELSGHGFDFAAPVVVFEATAAGRHTLAYGSTTRGKVLRRSSRPADAVLLAPGPEKEHAAAALPVHLTAPDVPQGSTRFSSSWKVLALAARPGGIVRLEVPDSVYAVARPDLGDLRLTAGSVEIPFFRWSPPDPKTVAERQDLPLASLGSARDRQVDIQLPGPGLPLTELHLTAPGPFRQSVEIRYAVPSPLRAGRRERTPAPGRIWECSAEDLLPCREAIPLPGNGLEILSLRFQDREKGGGVPLSGVDLELWRRTDVLLFAWPDEEPVRLLAGAAPLEAPSYGLAALGDSLLSRPWQPAELDLAGRAAARTPPWWSRWVRPAVLWFAAIGLLLLLRRILPDV